MTENKLKSYVEILAQTYEDFFWEETLEDIKLRTLRNAEERTQFPVSNKLHVLVETILWRGAEVRDAFEPLVPALEEEIERTSARDPRSGIPHLAVLNFASALKCLGLEPSARCIDIARHWLLSMETHRPEQFHLNYVRGFSALAFDEPRIYRPLAGFGLQDALPFMPGETFGFNLQGLLAHFAAAAERGAAPEDVRPAWLDFLTNFEDLTGAESLATADLLLVARVVHHRVGRAPLASVAQWLHDEVWSIDGGS